MSLEGFQGLAGFLGLGLGVLCSFERVSRLESRPLGLLAFEVALGLLSLASLLFDPAGAGVELGEDLVGSGGSVGGVGLKEAGDELSERFGEGGVGQGGSGVFTCV